MDGRRLVGRVGGGKWTTGPGGAEYHREMDDNCVCLKDPGLLCNTAGAPTKPHRSGLEQNPQRTSAKPRREEREEKQRMKRA